MILSKIKSYLIVACVVVVSILCFALYYYIGESEKKAKEIQILELSISGFEKKSTEYNSEIKRITEDLIRTQEALKAIEAQKNASETQRKKLVERLKKYEFDLQVQRDRIEAANILNEEYKNIIACIEKATGKDNLVCK